MECLAQYLDDLEDLFFAAALSAERLRRTLSMLIAASLMVAAITLGVLLALGQPPLALAVISLLMVTLLYRATVSPVRLRETIAKT